VYGLRRGSRGADRPASRDPAAIGPYGADEPALGAEARSREFDDLTHHGLVVFWHPLGGRPGSGILGGAPGSWCLTLAGAEAAGLPALRLA